MRAFIGWFFVFVISIPIFAHPLDSIRELKAGGNRPQHLNTLTVESNHHQGLVLVFFYSSQCPHCQTFAPIIQAFAKDNHWVLEPITVDGNPLPGFSYSIPADPTILKKAFQSFEVRYPATFIADKKTQILYPISFGEVSAQELSAQVRKFEASFYQGKTL